MKDPKITLDIVRVAANLKPDCPMRESIKVVRDAAELSRIANAIKRLNEADCNDPDNGDARDVRRRRLVAGGQLVASLYGATFYPYGAGGGLWPHVRLADGGEVTP
jgi:hypothetical protein